MAKKKASKAAVNKAAASASKAEQQGFELPKVSGAQRKRAERLLGQLQQHYPDAHCELNYTTPHELLIATILSAQSTDVGVNKATPALFKQFPKPTDYTASTPEEIEPYVRTTGFFRNKARAVHESMTAVVERFGGEVPRTMDELLSLRGVARKTANVVLGNAYGINVGFVVDTHVERLSNRLALVPEGSTVTMIERHLMALFPQDSWCQMSHWLIWHGRRACSARRPGGKCCRAHPVCDEFGIRCEFER